MIWTDDARAALATLQEVFGAEGFVLIGANALACHLEMTWRTTRDLDLAVAASRDGIQARLAEAGWRRDASFEIRWWTDAGVRLDVIPATPELIRTGGVELPEAGTHLTLLGFEPAFQAPSRSGSPMTSRYSWPRPR